MQLEQENEELLRDYIKNYKETKKVVPYVAGRFEIIDTYELQKTDLFPSGVVALAASNDFPQVLLEHVFTTAPENVAVLRANLPRGLDMRLEKTRDLAAIIHIERTSDGYLQFTAVPLLYGNWGVKGSVGNFSLEPPPELNLTAGAPIIRGQTRIDAMKQYAEARRARKPVAEEVKTPTEPELVRVETVKPGTAVPATGPLPDAPVATPIPMLAGGKPSAPGRPLAAPLRPGATPPRQMAMLSTPRPVPVATPLPLNGAAKPPLRNFIASLNASDLTAPSTQNWRTYSAGKQPPGRTVTPGEASALAERGELGERLYLRGNFVVTAAGESRAVLRSQGGGTEPARPGAGPARVIVEFPPSVAPPPEGSTFSRDASRGFEIRDVRKSADGQINIYVREVTQVE